MRVCPKCKKEISVLYWSGKVEACAVFTSSGSYDEGDMEEFDHVNANSPEFSCPECDAVRYGNLFCATCRSYHRLPAMEKPAR